MVYEELSARLNESGYKNWLKAGYCLLKVRDALHGFVNNEMKCFHASLINGNPVLQNGRRCRNSCRPKGNQLVSVCFLCEEWKMEILRHHTNRAGVVNWSNCKPWLWPSQHWEVAKAYMPRGQGNVAGAEHCDAAALLNLISFCDHFCFIDQHLVKEVIRQRNELMHSCEMRVPAQWMTQYHRSLEKLLLQLRYVPEVATASREIQEILSVDWSVCFPGLDSVDGPKWVGVEPGHISQVETQLLRERLQDLLIGTEAQVSEDSEELNKLKDFLQGQRDLEEQFQTELHSTQFPGLPLH